MRSACVLLLTCVALAGCRRTPPQPSPDYERAAVLYQQLYATKLDDAYGDPRMDEVVAGLRRVDPRSADARAARDMLSTIDRGREEFAQAAERRRQREEVSAAELKKSSNIDPQAILAAHEVPDAGAAQDPTGEGASIADLNRATGGCLVSYQPFREEGTGKVGELYKLAPSQPCRDKLPGFLGLAAMVVDGRIYRRIPEPPPAQRAPDGGADARAADAGSPAPKTGAAPRPLDGAQLLSTDPDGSRRYRYIPGGPTGDPAASAPGVAAAASDALPDATPHPPAADASRN
ncbi:MAG: hypothetical protein NVSMB23_08990 [Myxococcales bacterium]